MHHPFEDRFTSEREAAQYLGLSMKTLQEWRRRGGGPVYCKLGNAVRYRMSALDAFAAAGERRSTSDQGEAA